MLPRACRALLPGTAVFLLGTACTAFAATSSGTHHGDHVEAELISERRMIAPGEPLWLALRLLPDPGWHTYWRNPGDSGLETRVRWELPEGFTAEPIVWPIPQYLPVEHIVNYGMEGEHFLLTRIQAPVDLAPGSRVAIQARADWLVCKIECLPGGADLSLELRVGSRAEPAPEHGQAFRTARSTLPAAAPDTWKARFRKIGADRLVLEVQTGADGPRTTGATRFFPYRTDLVDHSAPQQVNSIPDGFRVEQRLSPLFRSAPEFIDGVVTFEQGGSSHGWVLRAAADPGLKPPPPADSGNAARSASVPATTPAERAPESGAAERNWEPFSEERLAELRREGRPVFVNMTADWCTTCLANERRVLDTQPVRGALLARGIVYLKGDWTEQDPAITAYLHRHGSHGVPLYVVYPASAGADARRLPQNLTPEIVLDALAGAVAVRNRADP